MNINEFINIKHKIAVELRQNQEIIDLLFDEVGYEPDEDEISQKIYTFNYVPDLEAETNSFICIDTEIVSIQNQTILDIDIYFWIIVHKNKMNLSEDFNRSGERKGDRRDRIAVLINEYMNGKYDFGKGKCEMKPTRLYVPSDKFVGRRLTYTVHATNRAGYPK